MTYWKEIRRELGIALLFVSIIIGISFCAEHKAVAQTVQPVYTRPSKGTVIQTFSAQQNTAIVTSTVYDWSAFTSASAFFKFAKADGTGCACPAGKKCTMNFSYSVIGSAVKTGPFATLDTFTANFPVTGTAADDVYQLAQTNVAVPFIKFTTSTGAFTNVTDGVPIATACFLTVAVTPVPFTYRVETEGLYPARTPAPNAAPALSGGIDYLFNAFGTANAEIFRVNEDGVLAVGGGAGSPLLPAGTVAVAASPAAATIVYDFGNTGRSGIRIENVGTNYVRCGAGEASDQTTITRYSFVLKAATGAGDGTGGVIDIPQFATRFGSDNSKRRVYCVAAAAGASSVAVMPY